MSPDSPSDDSGHLAISAGCLKYSSSFYGEWNLSISDIRVIGECTNQNGPWLDDYFLCFITEAVGWHEASFYAEGRDHALEELRKRLPGLAQLSLANSTDFASRVLWPESLAGAPMFKYIDKPRNRIMKALFGAAQNQQFLSSQVAGHVGGVTGCDLCGHSVVMHDGVGVCQECGTRITA